MLRVLTFNKILFMSCFSLCPALAENGSLNDQLRRYNSALEDQKKFTLRHVSYKNTAWRDLMFTQLTNTDFMGISVSALKHSR